MGQEPVFVRELVQVARTQDAKALEALIGQYILAAPLSLTSDAQTWATETRMAARVSSVPDANFADYRVYSLKGRLRLLRRVASIGRAPYNDVVLADESVSKVHAKVEIQSQKVYLVDAGSSQGTLINGRALGPGEKQLLQHKDDVTFGAVSMTFYKTERLHPILARMVDVAMLDMG